jgi:hypothetical protein
LSTGQEAVAVGIEHAITKEDNVDPLRVVADGRLLLRIGVMDSRICGEVLSKPSLQNCLVVVTVSLSGRVSTQLGHVVDDRWFNAHVRERILWREWYRRRSSPSWCWYAFRYTVHRY